MELPLTVSKQMWFQHDGALQHFSLGARQLLDGNFPNHWIGRGGTTAWPARSPDLTPIDFFFWGYVKNTVFAMEPASLEDLKERVKASLQNIPRQMLVCSRRNEGPFSFVHHNERIAL